MPRKIKATERSHPSSAEISGSDDSSSESEGNAGTFNEGKTPSKSSGATSTAAPKSLKPVCPTPVRIAVGTFSVLIAAGGCVMSVLGANGLYHPADTNISLHRGLLGGGLALVAVGGLGILSAFLEREHVQPATQA